MNINANFQSFPSSLDRLPFWAAPVQYAPKETLLAILSCSLRQSLLLYSTSYCGQRDSTTSNSSTFLAEEEPYCLNSKKEPVTAEPSDKPRELTALCMQEEEQKTVLSASSSPKQIKCINLLEFRDQLPLQNYHPSNFKKISAGKIKERKKKRRDSRDNSAAQLPKLNLIETAEVGGMGLDAGEIELRRRNLELRRVQSWSLKSTSRRDKRQIRMLNN